MPLVGSWREKCCALLLAGAAWAQVYGAVPLPSHEKQAGTAQLKSMSLEQLGNVEVTTVSKQPEEVWRTPAAIFVLTHDDIRRSGAKTIPDLLRLVPGVQVAQEQSDQWAVGIRGFDSPFSKGLLVLIDGRSVYTPLDEGVYWDVQDLVFDDIDRIEVIRGPGGTIWGPNAVNGVINIITRGAAATQGAVVDTDGGDAVERFNGSVRMGFRP
ncbi:MAG: TonB-dependent receptor plug domain-containing protein, partial [Acidobacteriota bacterium]